MKGGFSVKGSSTGKTRSNKSKTKSGLLKLATKTAKLNTGNALDPRSMPTYTEKRAVA